MFARTALLKRLPAFLLLLMTPVYYLVPWSSFGWRGESLGVVFFLAYAVFLTGLVLRRVIGRSGADPLSNFASAMVYGLAFMLLCMFGWTIARVSLDTVVRWMPVAFLAVGALGMIIPSHGDRQADAPQRKFTSALFTAFLILVAFAVYRSGVPIDFTKDTIDHVGYVQEIQDTRQAFPTTAFYKEGGANGEDIRKGFLHQFYGFASDYTGMDPLRFFNVITPVFSLLMLLVVYTVTLHWFNNRMTAVLAAVLYALTETGGLSTPVIQVSFYPSRFGIVFFFFLLVSMLDYLHQRGRLELARIALFAFAACATHVFFAVLIAVLGLTMLAWKNCFPQNGRPAHYGRILLIGAVVVAGAVPVTLFRYFNDFPEANRLHTELQAVLLIGPSYIAEPSMIFRWLGPLGVVATLCVFPLWRSKGANPAVGYLIAAALTLPILLLNPLVVPVLREVMTYLFYRITLLFPFAIVTAYYLVRFARERFGEHADGAGLGFGRRTVAILLVIAAVVQAESTVKGLSAAMDGPDVTHTYRLWGDGLRFLADEAPDGSVIASDPLTGYSIPAFTPHYVVCALDQHVPPNDVRLAERIADARDIVSPFVSMNRTTELLAKHGANYIVLNNRFVRRVLLHYWAMDASIFATSVDKFDSYPDLFTQVYATRDLVVFEWNGQLTDDAAVTPNPWRLDAVPNDFRWIEASAGEAMLDAARVRAGTVRAGDQIEVALVWSSEQIHELDNYVVAIRFDHMSPELPLGGRPFPKIARKAKEAMSGRRYRFRADHKIAGGFLSPDSWAPRERILDWVAVRLPDNLASGEYTVQARLLIVPHEPVHRLRDFLYDDDLFAGIEVGRIVVE